MTDSNDVQILDYLLF